MKRGKMGHILFPITYECNLACSGCSALGRADVIDISKSVSEIKKRVGEVEWVYITGGEPFIVPELISVCDELRSVGFKVGVTTNGTVYKPEIVDHVDRVGISIDGPREYHDAYRGEGVYDSAMKLFHAVKGKCETVIMSVAFRENLDELKKLKEVVEEIDPTYWQIQKDVNDRELVIPEF
jgi:MoaA/NifB/PqqE/SkfB family radical SAM enzyme